MKGRRILIALLLGIALFTGGIAGLPADASPTCLPSRDPLVCLSLSPAEVCLADEAACYPITSDALCSELITALSGSQDLAARTPPCTEAASSQEETSVDTTVAVFAESGTFQFDLQGCCVTGVHYAPQASSPGTPLAVAGFELACCEAPPRIETTDGVCAGRSDNPHHSTHVPKTYAASGHTICSPPQRQHRVHSWFYRKAVDGDLILIDEDEGDYTEPGHVRAIVSVGCRDVRRTYRIISDHYVLRNNGSAWGGTTSQAEPLEGCRG